MVAPGFPAGFFDRVDDAADQAFYDVPRLVLHLDDLAIAQVAALYEELGLRGRVLDLMGSWTSHFRRPPAALTVLGMNAVELAANREATDTVVVDLNREPQLPFADASFDAVVCCVSVDYLVRPLEVFAEVARVLVTAGWFVCTFSNRCFPTKAIQGWLYTSDGQHCDIVREYFRRSSRWAEPVVERRTAIDHAGDPLFAVYARSLPPPAPGR